MLKNRTKTAASRPAAKTDNLKKKVEIMKAVYDGLSEAQLVAEEFSEKALQHNLSAIKNAQAMCVSITQKILEEAMRQRAEKLMTPAEGERILGAL